MTTSSCKHKVIGGFLLTLILAPCAHAVTEAELEALEQQIRQQEAAQEKAKQKAEDERKRQAEEEARRIETEKLRVIEAKERELAEQIRLEAETREKAELQKRERYSALIREAEQAVSASDKELAISSYNAALTLYPGDTTATAGIQTARQLPEKVCIDFPGTWEWEDGGRIIIRADGTLTFEGGFSVNGTWTCADPAARLFTLKTGWGEQTAVLRSDGCLRGKGGGGREGCYWKKP